jgi:hypothetical protein
MVCDAAAAYERDLLRARTRAALQAKRARGERVGSVAYGCALAPDGLHLVNVAHEQATIARARRLARAGMSLRGVASALAREGRVSRSGRPFFAAQIVRLRAHRRGTRSALGACRPGTAANCSRTIPVGAKSAK